MMSVLQTIAAVLMLFFLPGYTFINMLFPKRGELDLEYDQLYRVGLGMGMSIVLSILIGYLLGYHRLFYAEYLWLALINLTIIFFIVGYLRGGYPTIRRLLGFEEKDKYDKLYLLDALLRERRKMIRELEELNRLAKLSPHPEKYRKERDRMLGEIKKLDERIDRLKGVVDEI